MQDAPPVTGVRDPRLFPTLESCSQSVVRLERAPPDSSTGTPVSDGPVVPEDGRDGLTPTVPGSTVHWSTDLIDFGLRDTLSRGMWAGKRGLIFILPETPLGSGWPTGRCRGPGQS